MQFFARNTNVYKVQFCVKPSFARNTNVRKTACLVKRQIHPLRATQTCNVSKFRQFLTIGRNKKASAKILRIVEFANNVSKTTTNTALFER